MRFAGQLLHRPPAARSPVDVVRGAAGIQAQDPTAGRLGVRARSARASGEDVDRARAGERSIVRTWAMRGTLHLIATEDFSWLSPLFRERELRWSRRRLAEALGVDRADQERAVDAIRRMLEADGAVTRGELLDRLESAGIDFDRRTAGHHLPRLAAIEGIAMMGPERGRETTYVLQRDWIGELAAVDRDRALAELTRRYVQAFGPADEEDLAAWSGLGLGECRVGFAAISSELAEVRVGARRLFAIRRGGARAPRGRRVRLLPGFDNYLLGHRDREFAVTGERVGRIWPGGGIIRPTVVVDGRAVGTWASRRGGGRLRVSVDAFGPLDAEVRAAISREVDDIGRFEGLPVTLVAD